MIIKWPQEPTVADPRGSSVSNSIRVPSKSDNATLSQPRKLRGDPDKIIAGMETTN